MWIDSDSQDNAIRFLFNPSTLPSLTSISNITKVTGYLLHKSVKSAASARLYLPYSLKPGETPKYIRTQLRYVSAMIMGRISIVEDSCSEGEQGEAEHQFWLDDYAEMILERKSAEIARDKLDVMTRQGSMRLTQ